MQKQKPQNSNLILSIAVILALAFLAGFKVWERTQDTLDCKAQTGQATEACLEYQQNLLNNKE